MFHGFQQAEGTGMFRATADQIVVLMTAAPKGPGRDPAEHRTTRRRTG